VPRARLAAIGQLTVAAAAQIKELSWFCRQDTSLSQAGQSARNSGY